MANDWYVKFDGKTEHGPISSGTLKQLAQQGKVTPDTPVKHGQAGTWHRATDVHGLFAAPSGQGTHGTTKPSPKSDSPAIPEMKVKAPQAPIAANTPQQHVPRGPSPKLSVPPINPGGASPPSAGWYVCENGKTFGPYSDVELKQLAHEGTIDPAAQVKEGEHGRLMPASQVLGIAFPPRPDVPPATPTETWPSAAPPAPPRSTPSPPSEHMEEMAADWIAPVPKDVHAPTPRPAARSRVDFDGPVAPPPPPPIVESPRARIAPAGSVAPQSPATKSCPFCGETILLVAKKCKHCGCVTTRNAGLEARSAAKSAANRRLSPITKLVSIGTVLFILVGFLVKHISDHSTGVSDPGSGYYIGVSARELVAAYEDNEVAADACYKGKVIKVSGVINSVGKDILGTPYVALSSGREMGFRCVQCLFAGSKKGTLISLSKGKSVTIKGRCVGLMGNVLIEECVIVAGE